MGRRRRGRRRRRRSGLLSAASRTIRNVGQGVSKAVNQAASAVGLKNTNKSGWGAKQGDMKGGGFVRVTDKGSINIRVTTPAEMGDKVDIDWDNTELTNSKMLRVHIHRLAGPIPDPPGKKK